MRSGDAALRLSVLFAVVGFITKAAGIYEMDRREKSGSETITTNLAGIEQRVRILSGQIGILGKSIYGPDQHRRATASLT
jgi:hypothetical protein